MVENQQDNELSKRYIMNPRFDSSVKCPSTKLGGSRTFQWLDNTFGLVQLDMWTISSLIKDFRKVNEIHDTPAEDILGKIWRYGESFETIQNVRTLAEVGLFSLTNYLNADKLMA